MQEEYWITKDKKKIAVADMDEQHVRNALRLMLKWKREEDTEEYDPYEDCYGLSISDIC